MGFWDVLLFNIATVLGPRWIAAAGHNGTSSISLWVIAALFFFVPGAFVINELSSRFPDEGGLYVWAKEAFGDFSGFVAGERFNERIHCGGKGRRPVAGPNISSGRFACAARRGGTPQYHWPECWKVAAEFRRRRHVSPAPDVGRCGPAGLLQTRRGDAFYLGQHGADLELGHGEFLVADCLCVYRARTGLGDERRSP